MVFTVNKFYMLFTDFIAVIAKFVSRTFCNINEINEFTLHVVCYVYFF